MMELEQRGNPASTYLMNTLVFEHEDTQQESLVYSFALNITFLYHC